MLSPIIPVRSSSNKRDVFWTQPSGCVHATPRVYVQYAKILVKSVRLNAVCHRRLHGLRHDAASPNRLPEPDSYGLGEARWPTIMSPKCRRSGMPVADQEG